MVIQSAPSPEQGKYRICKDIYSGSQSLTLTKYSGLDPELGGWDTTFGMDAGNYPLVKQYLVGLNVNF